MATQPNEGRTQVAVIRQNLNAMAPELQKALPPHITVEKFTRVAMTAIQANPNLQKATHQSLFGSIVRLAQDGLLPDGREAAIVMFKDVAQAMPMIAGILKKMRQSGEIAWVDAHVVYEKDSFTYRPGVDEQPLFEPDWFAADRGKPVGVYAIAKLKTGEIVPPEIMSVAQVEKVRNVSRAKNNGPWVDWWDQMALKTVLRRISKRLPSNTDLAEMFDRDETMAVDFARPQLRAVEDAPRMSRLDQIEAQIEAQADESAFDDAAADVDQWQAELGQGDDAVAEAEIEEIADQEPAWKPMVDDWTARIAKADMIGTVIAIRGELKPHIDALPDAVVHDLQKALDEAALKFTTKGE